MTLFDPQAVTTAGAGTRARNARVPLPRPLAGTRVETRTINLVIAVDESPSTGWTDPDGARIDDTRYVCKWLDRHFPNDLVTLVTFDSEATAHGTRSPAAARAQLSAGLRHGSLGGTLYVPVVEKAAAIAGAQPELYTELAVVTDGMSPDIAACADLLDAKGMTMLLIPFGQDWPWIAADWDHPAIRFAEHVENRPRAIARALALTFIHATGSTYDGSVRAA